MAKAVPLSYTFKNLWFRRVTTILTAGGMALVIFVFAAVLMLSAGIEESLVATGQADNVKLLRKGASAEIASAISRQQASAIRSMAGIATDGQGRKIVSLETVVLNNLPKRSNGSLANVPVRGVTEFGVSLRPQVRIVDGRMFRPGTSEIIAGASTARSFAHMAVGETLHFAGRDWTVVGIYDASRTAFDSEIWADADQIMQAFHRDVYTTVVFKLADASGFNAMRERLLKDPRLEVDVKSELRYYAEQSETLSKFIRLLGTALSVIFSIGAIIGAMITMFGAVASRVGEIGTLRALGFRREAVLVAFLGESIGFALVGGVIGLLAATGMQAVNISTINFATLSEMTFHFRMTTVIVLQTLTFAVVMGFLGGFIPALRASQMKIVDCLREA
jgi:putative ABC transport system permease protein